MPFPFQILQRPGYVVFLYEFLHNHRIISTAPRPHLDGIDFQMGDPVAHWDGDSLVIDVTNFNDKTWLDSARHTHSDAMHVTERFWKNGANLVYQVTVEDPKVLAAPWTMAPRVIKPSTDPLEESPKCTEADAKLLVNDDHHGQR